MYQGIATKCLTGVVRLSYVHLDSPYSNNNDGAEKYSTTLLIPKSDFQTKADVDQAMDTAVQNGIQGCWNGVKPPVVAYPIYDGDGVRPASGEPFGEECKGHWVMTASSKNKPEVVHISNINAQLAPHDIYSGMYARVTINFFAYASNGKKGIGCGLGNVLKIQDGEPLGGRTNASSDFADLAGDANTQQSQYQQPVQQPMQQAQYQQQPIQQAQPQYQQQMQQPQQQAQYQQQMQQPQQQAQYQQPVQQPQQQAQYQQPQQPPIDPITGQPMPNQIFGIQ